MGNSGDRNRVAAAAKKRADAGPLARLLVGADGVRPQGEL